jgi:ABC-type transport system involved in multi-copper enzyme maturation permease subunit
MTTDTLVKPAAAPRHSAGGDLKVTQWRVIRSEWVKFWSLRSSYIALGCTVLGMIAFGALFAGVTASRWATMPARFRDGFDPTGTSLQGFALAQLVIGVLGVLIVSGEYSTGMIRSSMAAAPKRLPVVWGKAIVFTAIAFVSAEVASFVSFYVGQALLSSQHIQTTLSAPEVLRAVFGTGLYLTGVGLLGVGFGWIIRNTAGGIATLVGLLLILPELVRALPQSWQDHIDKYLPSNAGMAVTAVQSDPGTLAPWTGFLVFCVYLVVALAAALVLVRRRDA